MDRLAARKDSSGLRWEAMGQQVRSACRREEVGREKSSSSRRSEERGRRGEGDVRRRNNERTRRLMACWTACGVKVMVMWCLAARSVAPPDTDDDDENDDGDDWQYIKEMCPSPIPASVERSSHAQA